MTKMAAAHSVNQIGTSFVKQYYLQMHQNPSQLHRFYQEDSSLAHGGNELGTSEAVKGQKAIHEKIQSLDLTDCRARIKQVDSHATLGNGIVIQVTGELSTHGSLMRSFVQTFVLAPKSETHFYILNDIFRFQEDVYDATSESENNEVQSDRGEPALNQLPPDTPPTVSYAPVQGEVDRRSPLEPTAPPQHQQVEELPVEDKHPEGGWQTFNGEPDQKQHTVPLTGAANFQEFGDETGDPPVPTPPPQQPEASPAPPEKQEKTSWAGLVSRGGTTQAPPPSQPLPPPPQTQPKPPRRSAGDAPHGPLPLGASASPNTSREKPPRKTPVGQGVPDSQQIFIGGLPAEVTEEEVRKLFEPFGGISEVRLNPKNFGFVVFEGADAVRKILDRKANQPFHIRSKTVNIEAKKSGNKPSGPPGRSRGEGLGSMGSRSGMPRGGSSRPPRH